MQKHQCRLSSDGGKINKDTVTETHLQIYTVHTDINSIKEESQGAYQTLLELYNTCIPASGDYSEGD